MILKEQFSRIEVAMETVDRLRTVVELAVVGSFFCFISALQLYFLD